MQSFRDVSFQVQKHTRRHTKMTTQEWQSAAKTNDLDAETWYTGVNVQGLP